jgi:2TM domain
MMDTPMTEDQLRKRAKRGVGLKFGWAIHALVYVLVNVGLYAINQYTGGARWSHFPMLGWGLGLAIHGVVVLVSLYGDGMREDMVNKEMDRLRR